MQKHLNPLRICAAMAAAFVLATLSGPALGQTVTYQYDSLGRVISSSSTNGAQTTYQYDPAGNRTNQTIVATKPIAGPVYFPLNERTLDQNYPAQTVPLNLKGAPATGVFIAQTPGPNAVASGDGHTITYLPNIDFYGLDSFQYLASNANGASAPATVTVNVKLLPPIAMPIEQNVAVDSRNNAINTVTIEATSVLKGGQVFNISIVGCTTAQIQQGTCHTQNGIVSGTEANNRYVTILYTPNPGFTGDDQFTYQVSNSAGPPSSALVKLHVRIGLATWSLDSNPQLGFTWGDGTTWAVP